MLTRGMTAPLTFSYGRRCSRTRRHGGCPDAVSPTASELGQLRAWRRDPYQARAEIDDQGGVILDADDPAEAVLIVCHLVLDGEVLGRGKDRRGREGTRGQEAPGGGAGRFHHYQYAPLTLSITAAR